MQLYVKRRSAKLSSGAKWGFFSTKSNPSFTGVNALYTCLEYLLVREELACDTDFPCEWLWQAKRFLEGEERILTYHDILTLSRSVCSFAPDNSFAHSTPSKDYFCMRLSETCGKNAANRQCKPMVYRHQGKVLPIERTRAHSLMASLSLSRRRDVADHVAP